LQGGDIGKSLAKNEKPESSVNRSSIKEKTGGGGGGNLNLPQYLHSQYISADMSGLPICSIVEVREYFPY